MQEEDPAERIKRLMREGAAEPSKVVDFASAAKKRGRQVAALGEKAKTVSIHGNNNVGVSGNHNNVNISVRGAPGKAIQVSVQPGEQHISDEQAVEVRDLVAKVVTASGRDFQFVWGTLKKKFRFSKYQLLDREKFEAVRAYLRKWIASSGPGASRPSTINRKTALARIHVESKKVAGLPDRVHEFIRARFGVTSLGDLTVEQLSVVIRAFDL